MKILSLPYCEMDAYRNMAIDQWMLSLADERVALVFRHYGWTNPAITYGYTQKSSEIEARAEYKGLERCRRPSGGGVVDHRSDYTYALVLPKNFKLTQSKPLELYAWLHAIWVKVIGEFSIRTELYDPDRCGQGGCLTCFEAPSPYDVVIEGSAAKLAGAAMKRTRDGVLFQGSLWKPLMPKVSNDEITNRFLKILSQSLNMEVHPFEAGYSMPAVIAYDLAFRKDSWNARR